MLKNSHGIGIDELMRLTLGFLKKLTLHPDSVSREDVATLEAAAIGRKAIRDAIYVCSMMNIMDRLEHAFGFSEAGASAGARSLRLLGYRMMP